MRLVTIPKENSHWKVALSTLQDDSVVSLDCIQKPTLFSGKKMEKRTN